MKTTYILPKVVYRQRDESLRPLRPWGQAIHGTAHPRSSNRVPPPPPMYIWTQNITVSLVCHAAKQRKYTVCNKNIFNVPNNFLFAAFTITSTSCVVISPSLHTKTPVIHPPHSPIQRIHSPTNQPTIQLINQKKNHDLSENDEQDKKKRIHT